MTLAVGLQPIPGYTLTGPLGAGAFAEVWEAIRDNGNKVALKFLDTKSKNSSLIANEVRLLRELSQLRHPHIIPMLGVHANSKYVIISMERATCNLADLCRAYQTEKGRYLPVDHALDLLNQAASALDFLSTLRLRNGSGSHGLQHCDIKPSNLLLVGGQLKVADFGLCAGSGWQTHSRGWKGTPPYAAPELWGGAGVPGTDQYALAVTFCEMVMGDRVFFARVPNAPPRGIPIDLTKLRDKEVPVISRALHTYPSSRYPSCTAFIQALRAAVHQPEAAAATRIFPRGIRGPLRAVGVS